MLDSKESLTRLLNIGMKTPELPPLTPGSDSEDEEGGQGRIRRKR